MGNFCGMTVKFCGICVTKVGKHNLAKKAVQYCCMAVIYDSILTQGKVWLKNQGNLSRYLFNIGPRGLYHKTYYARNLRISVIS